MIDGENPVAQLCIAGMQAERAGRNDEARACYQQAWEISRNSYDACIAAHFLARRQDGAEASLHWNQVALDCAQAVGDERVYGFYPSLYLNLGWSYESLGDLAAARRCYETGAAWIEQLGADPYAAVVRGGLARALERTEPTPPPQS